MGVNSAVEENWKIFPHHATDIKDRIANETVPYSQKEIGHCVLVSMHPFECIETWTQWPIYCKRLFQRHFLTFSYASLPCFNELKAVSVTGFQSEWWPVFVSNFIHDALSWQKKTDKSTLSINGSLADRVFTSYWNRSRGISKHC